MDEIASNLAKLTEQLNRFKPAHEADVQGSQEKLSSDVDEKLNLQSSRIDAVSESVHEARKTTQDNAELLQTLLVSIENLGENFKQMREEMNTWGGPEDQEILDELVNEVPEIPPTSEQP